MAQILRFFAGEGLRETGQRATSRRRPGASRTHVRRPLGVVGLITPWNFPAAIPAWKTAPALAYGNTVVMKLAQDAPLHRPPPRRVPRRGRAPGRRAQRGRRARLGGRRRRSSSTRGCAPSRSPARSRSVARCATRRPRAAQRVQLELGGHNPLIVMADADLDRAVEAAYAGAFWSAGQKCTATRRILVEDPSTTSSARCCSPGSSAAVVGDPSDPATEVGPIVNEAQLDEVLAGDRARPRGRRHAPRRRRADRRRGYLLAPTLFEGRRATTRSSPARRCSGRSPRSTGSRRSTRRSARANAVEYGLSASIFTLESRLGADVRQEIEAGIIRVNGQTAGADVHVPFGGVKSSGFGPHEQGRAAIEFYTELVTVYEDACRRHAFRAANVPRMRRSAIRHGEGRPWACRGRRVVSGERFLVTGALGCIGPRSLLAREGTTARTTSETTTAASPGRDTQGRAGPRRRDRRRPTRAHAADEHGITHVVHLAALQVPVRQGEPAARRARQRGRDRQRLRGRAPTRLTTTLAYASTAAVYDDLAASARPRR